MRWMVNIFSKQGFDALDQRYDAIGGMLSRMIDRADDFCKYEPGTDYRAGGGRMSVHGSLITDHDLTHGPCRDS
jgi:hypothetical protein